MFSNLSSRLMRQVAPGGVAMAVVCWAAATTTGQQVVDAQRTEPADLPGYGGAPPSWSPWYKNPYLLLDDPSPFENYDDMRIRHYLADQARLDYEDSVRREQWRKWRAKTGENYRVHGFSPPNSDAPPRFMNYGRYYSSPAPAPRSSRTNYHAD